MIGKMEPFILVYVCHTSISAAAQRHFSLQFQLQRWVAALQSNRGFPGINTRQTATFFAKLSNDWFLIAHDKFVLKMMYVHELFTNQYCSQSPLFHMLYSSGVKFVAMLFDQLSSFVFQITQISLNFRNTTLENSINVKY